MENKIDNSIKIITGYGETKKLTTIKGDEALQMFKEGKIKQESVQISDKGIATFQDKNGNSFRAELTKEQITAFKINPIEKNYKGNLPPIPENIISLGKDTQLGSAKSFTSIFDDKNDKDLMCIDKTLQPLEINKKVNSDNGWKVNFSFGYNRTKYADTDMHLKSSRVDVTIKNFSFKERTSSDFYNPKNWEGIQDAARWIDEPTNSFNLSAEKNNNVFYLNAFHPKFLKENFENKHVIGTVDGIAVDKVMPINEEFDGYNDKPGEMHMTRFENTHKQMDWQLGYGRNIDLIDTKKYGKLVYTPSIYAGVTSGKHYDSYLKPNEYWEGQGYEDKNKIQGVNASIGNKLKYEYGKANIFVENKFTVSHLKNQFMDGTAEYNMKYNATTFGVGYQLYQSKPKPKLNEP